MTGVLFRVDAGVGIGHGHVFRCLTVAAVLQEYHLPSLFVCKAHPGNLAKEIEAAGFPCQLLPLEANGAIDVLNYESWVGGAVDEDAKATLASCAEHEAQYGEVIDTIVVDHYGLGAHWERSFLDRGLKVWAIDDLANREHTVTGLVDSGVNRSVSDYSRLIGKEAKVLAGASFALLRPEFSAARRGVANHKGLKGNTLLVMFGGVDREDWSSRVLGALVDCALSADYRVRIVIGSGYTGRAGLERLRARAGFEVEILQNVDDVAAVMAEADLCVGGGGGAALERCCLGLPTLMFQLADNQAHNCRALEEAGAAICVSDPEPHLLDAKMILNLLSDSTRLSAMSAAASRLVDGFGARRVVSQLLGITASDETEVFLRPFEVQDCEQIFAWQSQPGNRHYFRNPEVPGWEEHRAWFQSIMNSPGWNRIIMRHQEPVGLIRIMPYRDGGEVSVLIDQQSQGAGIGKLALELLIREKADEVLYAEIYNENLASVRLFEKAGFRPLPGRLYRRSPSDHSSN